MNEIDLDIGDSNLDDLEFEQLLANENIVDSDLGNPNSENNNGLQENNGETNGLYSPSSLNNGEDNMISKRKGKGISRVDTLERLIGSGFNSEQIDKEFDLYVEGEKTVIENYESVDLAPLIAESQFKSRISESNSDLSSIILPTEMNQGISLDENSNLIIDNDFKEIDVNMSTYSRFNQAFETYVIPEVLLENSVSSDGILIPALNDEYPTNEINNCVKSISPYLSSPSTIEVPLNDSMEMVKPCERKKNMYMEKFRNAIAGVNHRTNEQNIKNNKFPPQEEVQVFKSSGSFFVDAPVKNLTSVRSQKRNVSMLDMLKAKSK